MVSKVWHNLLLLQITPTHFRKSTPCAPLERNENNYDELLLLLSADLSGLGDGLPIPERVLLISLFGLWCI